MRLPAVSLCLAVLLLSSSCATELGSGADCGGGDCDTVTGQALCEVTVEGVGTLMVEDVYLPGVVACESAGEAEGEVLLAQAIAARSWLYQNLGSDGVIGNGEHAQVYSCSYTDVKQKHIDAVNATRGQVLAHDGTIVSSFYVSGAVHEPPTCTGGTYDPTNTERLVTVNEGLTGDDVQPSRQGSASNPANRGTMSQHGSLCLAEIGYDHQEILKYYYGADIEIVQLQGECVGSVTDVSASDIGAACAGSGSGGCDDTCHEWYLPTINQSFGMCSAECTGDCPTGSACVELASGQNRCAPEPAEANDYCFEIAGTVPRVLETATGTWASVCASPGVGTKCDVGVQRGECVDTTVSPCNDGFLEPGACPGDANIQCCIR